MVVTYLHLYYHVLWRPGYLPVGDQKLRDEQNDDDEKRPEKSRRRRHRKKARKADPEKTVQSDTDVERGAGGVVSQSDLQLESFYTQDVFVCQQDGRPLWCSTCDQYKTDRAHHCRELGRCVRKMDHFCPWYVLEILSQIAEYLLTSNRVGGVVSETSFKFFIQFVVYTCIYCTFALIVSAYFTAEIRRNVSLTATPIRSCSVSLIYR